jgi:peptide chain release factor 2
MRIDTLRELLKSCETDIAAIKTFYERAHIQQECERLAALMNTEDSWKNPDHIAIAKEYQKYLNVSEEYQAIITQYQEALELIELFADDEEALAQQESGLFGLKKKITNFKLSLLLGKDEDAGNCFFTINAGAGGTESQDWAEMLLRMYLRFCEREKLTAQILDYQNGEEAGIKSATLYIKGKYAFGLLNCEVGIHRLVRISPFDSNKRRHTSFAAVSILADYTDATIEINEEDLRIDTYRAGGAGGQHVNKTESAVRITHLPTGIVVQCQNERSQGQNKQIAMKMLMAKLIAQQKEERLAREQSIEKKKIEWGSQIRSYVLHPYKMVKDHRTELESPQPLAVLDGEIIDFIEAYLVSHATLQ